MTREIIDVGTLSFEDDDAKNQVIKLVDEAIIYVCENHAVHGQKDEQSGVILKPQEYIAHRLDKESYNASKLSRLRKHTIQTQYYFNKRIECLKRFEVEFNLLFYREFPFVSGPQKKSPSGLHRIAEKLALNLVDVSSRLRDTLPYQEILKEKRLWENRIDENFIPRERIIAIVGAGGSNAATPQDAAIPTSREALLKIKSAFDHKLLKELIKENLEEINSQLGSAEEDDFERNMKALIRLSPKKVVEKLKELCGYRQAPSLLYEILAHLLKHRFLDGIVNFNYDELLDNAIEEELPNKEDYRFIYTAGHCPETLAEISINNRIKHPIYVKCHGTISHPNSLRFREKDAFTIEKAIQKHLRELFTAMLPRQEVTSKAEMPLNLLIFGFAMKNQVFNKIIEQVYYQKEKRIFIWLFDKDEKLKERIVNRFKHLRNKSDKSIKIYRIDVLKYGGMEATVKELWKLVKSCFQTRYEPKGIARHELINHLFKNISPISLYGKAGKSAREKYHTDRLYVEIAIHLLQSNGKLHLKQVSGNRIGKNFNALEKKNRPSIQTFLTDMGLDIYKDFIHDTYMIPEASIRNNKELLIQFVQEKLVDKVQDSSVALLLKPSVKQEGQKNFRSYADAVMKRRLDMVNPKFINVHNNLFSDLTDDDVMNTSLAWIYNYRRAINQSDKWDLMLSVTEQGRFLRDDLDNPLFDDKYFELILATFDLTGSYNEYTEQLNKLNCLSDEIYFRPWWRHNQHMVVLMKRKKNSNTGNWQKDWKLHQAFYYTHRMLSRRITPVKVRKKEDAYKLLSVYAAYWKGAQTYTQTAKAEGKQAMLSVVSNRDEIDQVLQQLFNKYDKKIAAKT